MALYTYYTFTLKDGVAGLQRAFMDADVVIQHVQVNEPHAAFQIEIDGKPGEIHLEETVASDHPLARLGRVSAVQVTIPDGDGWKILESILTLAFLRGGG